MSVGAGWPAFDIYVYIYIYIHITRTHTASLPLIHT